MSREIKFRVWLNGRFYYWGFLRDEIMDSLYFAGVPSCNESEAYNLEHTQQFTGLLDRNSKEIYEGDIIKKRDGFNAIIRIKDLISGDYILDALDVESGEVIGNLFEGKKEEDIVNRCLL